jgi:2-polyprenyl-6-methoxyphenol hydroxylase-like FAD-dependent oxidoreductase
MNVHEIHLNLTPNCCFIGFGYKMYGSYASIVWSTTNSHADWLLKVSPKVFVEELNHRLVSPSPSSILTGLFPITQSFRKPQAPIVKELVGKRGAFPLRFSHSEEYIRPRFALIGYDNDDPVILYYDFVAEISHLYHSQ